jgi:SDR family mycofactocin-dependent oxidoreductase
MAGSFNRFEGKVAVVTGAARGQGRAEAVRLASEGADIVAIDICKPIKTVTYKGATRLDLEETVRLVEAEGRKILAFETDIRDLQAMTSAVAEGVAAFGHLDVVIANAGMTSGAMSWEMSMEVWQETIDINLTGAWVTARATVPTLIEQGTGGAIVFTSSVAGLRGLPFLAHYAAAKHGLVGLSRTMANELGQYNIRVNTVHPWGVHTDLLVHELEPLRERFPETLAPMFNEATLPFVPCEPEDIANAVAWLASYEASHVTGIQLPVDRGVLTR